MGGPYMGPRPTGCTPVVDGVAPKVPAVPNPVLPNPTAIVATDCDDVWD
jgi:hypothetical protein